MKIPGIGLNYYKARFYDSQIGRFMTPDPAGMVDGPNLYAYVLNDPLNATDPSGLFLMGDSEGRCVETEDIVIVAPSPFTGVAFDHPPSNGNGQLNNTGRGSGTLAAPPMMMMMCPAGSNAAAVSQALANSSGNLRAQQEIFRNYTNERSGELFAEAAGLYGQLAVTAAGLGLVRAEAASGAISYLFGRHGPVFGSNFYRGNGRAGFMNQGRLPNNFRLGFGFRLSDKAEVFRAAIGTNKNTKHVDICVVRSGL